MIAFFIILGVFAVIVLVEIGYLWFQWDKISVALDVTKGVVNITGQKEKLDVITSIVMSALSKFKGLVAIPIVLVLFVDFMASVVLGFILSGIHSIILLFV